MFFLYIIVIFVVMFAIFVSLQKSGITARGYRQQDDFHRIQNPQFRNYRPERNCNPLFAPFRGTLDDDHVDIIGDQVIKHQDTEKGYVILNGVKRRVKDCKDL